MRHIPKGLAVLSIGLAIGLTTLWVRSYYAANRLHGRAKGKESFLVASKQGRLVFLWFTSHGHPDWWKWETRSYLVDDAMSFPVGDVRQYERIQGLGMIHRPIYHVMPPVIEKPDGTNITVFRAATATLRGSGVILPFWPFVLATLLPGWLLIKKRSWQFGIRTLLVTVTLVAVVLAFDL